MNAAPTLPTIQAAVRVRQLQSLPPLPAVAQRLLKDLEREDLNLVELSSIIEMDPGLTARLLGLANSAYFSGGGTVSSVRDAVGRVLGLDLVKNLALGIVLSGPFDARCCHGFRAEQFWYQAMGASSLAGHLAALLERPPEHDWLYLGGLLHELGLLALCSLFPTDMARVFSAQDGAGPEPKQFSTRVRGELGITPEEAGAILARRWRLPEPLPAVMTHWRNPDYRGDQWRFVALVGLAACLGRDLYRDENTDAGIPWIKALGLSVTSVEEVVERFRGRAESLLALARHMAVV